MPRTKGSKNRVTASTDFDAQIAKLQKDKAMLEEGLSKTVAHIEELKTDIRSLRESLKPQKAEIKQLAKQIAPNKNLVVKRTIKYVSDGFSLRRITSILWPPQRI